jgi:hypothetical protein
VIVARGRAVVMVLLLGGVSLGAGGSGDEAGLYAAAIRHVAKAAGCTKNAPCCFSVAGKVPSAEMAKAVSSAVVKPVPESGVCAEMTLVARRLPSSDSELERIEVAAGVGGSLLSGCTYALRLTRKGWEVVPSETACPLE